MLSRSVKLGGCPIPIGGNRWRTVSKSRWQGAGTPSRHIMRATSGADGNTRVTGNESALRDAQGNTDSDDKTREASTSGSSVASGENSQKRDDGSHNSEGPVWRKIATRIVHTAVGVLASIARGIAKLVPQPVAEAFAKVMSVIRPILPVLVFAGFFFASNAGRAPGPR